MTLLKEACIYSGKRGKPIVDKISLEIARFVARQLRQSLAAVHWDRPGLPATNLEPPSPGHPPPPSSAATFGLDPVKPNTRGTPRPTGSGGGSVVAKAPASSSKAVAPLTAPGGTHGMAAHPKSSTSSALLSARGNALLRSWQARATSTGAPPPGTHRGQGALPASDHTVPTSPRAKGKAEAIASVGKAASGAVVSVPSPPEFGSLSSPVAVVTPCDRAFASARPGPPESTEAAISLERAREAREDTTQHR